MNTKPIKIFISYSHENDIWLTQYLDIKKHKPNPKYLLDFWERSLRGKSVEFWYDRDEKQGIRGGDRWRNRIFEEIDNADIAILLITQDFIISPFIRDEELPSMLNRSKHGDLELLPILLEPARLKDLDIDNTFQIVPGRPTPLCEYFESENDWKKVRLEVIESIENVIEKVIRKRNLIEPAQITKTELVSNEIFKVNSPLKQNYSGESIPSREKKLSWFMKTTTGPEKRSSFGMIYDFQGDVILLNGGYGLEKKDMFDHKTLGLPNSALGDTWIWNGSVWKLIENNQLRISKHSIAFDRNLNNVVISGGQISFDSKLEETYRWCDNEWIIADVEKESGPGSCGRHAMAFDEKRNTIILFVGNFGYSFYRGPSAIGDTWEWNGLIWSKLQVEGPDPRWEHCLVYDENASTILLYGGKNGKGCFDDTWIWEGITATWSKIATENMPSARCSHAMTYDRVSKKVLLFGGKTQSGDPLNDLWEWDGSDWKLLMEHAPPKPRYDHGFVYDEKRNKTILFGGYDGKDYFQDTWKFTY